MMMIQKAHNFAASTSDHHCPNVIGKLSVETLHMHQDAAANRVKAG
jgi:hypothetical protein